MDYTGKNCCICQNLDDAKAVIAEHVPNYHLDFMGGFSGPTGDTLCWRISPVGIDHMYWAGTLTELPNGEYMIELRPGVIA